jgi:hypothetical protein
MIDKKKYEAKFPEFIRMIKETALTGATAVCVHDPETLGGGYDELVESLNRLSAAGLALHIVPPNERVGAKGR